MRRRVRDGAMRRSGKSASCRCFRPPSPPFARSRAVSAYEQVTRRGLDDLAGEVHRIENKVNALLIGLAVSLLADLARAVVR